MIVDKQLYSFKNAKKSKPFRLSQIKYKNALKLANETDLESVNTFILPGNFIFGDYIEALISERLKKCQSLHIATLSMSEDNVDSLRNLYEWGSVTDLHLFVSDHFYSHERRNLIPYLYKELVDDIDDKMFVTLSVGRVHMKVCLIEKEDKRYVIHGSANLRSSDNVEQITVEENKELYNFYLDYLTRFEEKYKCKKKSLTTKELKEI